MAVTDRTLVDLGAMARAMGAEVHVGWVKNPDPQAFGTGNGALQHTGSDESIATIGAFHEFGTVDMIERAPIRSTLDADGQRFDDALARDVGLWFDQKLTAREVQARHGERVASRIRTRIKTRRIRQDLRKSKTSGRPALIGPTEELIDAIRWEIQ